MRFKTLVAGAIKVFALFASPFKGEDRRGMGQIFRFATFLTPSPP
jgi:hypothetical protein